MAAPSVEKDLYKVLGVERGVDKEELRRAYKRLSMKHHPDKGGNEEDFKAIARAHDVLTDDRKRQVYDMTGNVEGENGMQEGSGGGGGGGGGGPFGGAFGGGGFPTGGPFQQGGAFPFDFGSLFGMFGAGGAGGGQPQGPRVRRAKAPPKLHEIPLTLSDFYNGRTIQIQFERQKFCDGCKGDGCKTFTACGGCQGRGFIEHIMMIGPGMQAVQRGPCATCAGEGKQPGIACTVCKGRKFTTHEKVLTIRVEPGMKVQESLVFERECSDNHEFVEAGDVHIVLTEADENSIFKREGTTLHVNLQLCLSECLLGCQKTLTGHPGFTEGLVIDLPAGLMSGTTHTIEGKGMPRRPEGGHGILLCHIRVVVTDAEREKLGSQTAMLRAIFA
jgi:DnaJ-class molecular chaperone